MPKMGKIWNLKTDSAWIELARIQALQAGRASPCAYVRDLIWLMVENPKLRYQIRLSIQGVHYGKPG